MMVILLEIWACSQTAERFNYSNCVPYSTNRWSPITFFFAMRSVLPPELGCAAIVHTYRVFSNFTAWESLLAGDRFGFCRSAPLRFLPS